MKLDLNSDSSVETKNDLVLTLSTHETWFDNNTSASNFSASDVEVLGYIPEWIAAIEGGCLAMVCLLSVIGNFCVSFALIKRKHMNLPSNRLVFSLTASNLIQCLLVLPWTATTSALRSWSLGTTWCRTAGFFTLLVPLASLITLALISVDRYFAIARPMIYSRVITLNRCSLVLTIAWCYAALCALPPLIGWSKYEYRHSQRSCAIAWYSSPSYSIFILVACILPPMIVMAICYYHILQVAHKKSRKIHVGTVSAIIPAVMPVVVPPVEYHPKKHLRLSFNETDREPIPCLKPAFSSPTLGSGLQAHHSFCQKILSRRKPAWVLFPQSLAKGIRTVCLVLGTVLVSWVPYMILMITETVSDQQVLPQWYSFMAVLLYFAGSVSYPVIYGFYNRLIRKDLHAAFCPSRRKRAACGLLRKYSRKASSISGQSGSLVEPFPNILRTLQINKETPQMLIAPLDIFNTIRKPSQDSGTVMTDCESDIEGTPPTNQVPAYPTTSGVYKTTIKRRNSAPSILISMKTIPKTKVPILRLNSARYDHISSQLKDNQPMLQNLQQKCESVIVEVHEPPLVTNLQQNLSIDEGIAV